MVNSEPWQPRTLMITAALLFANFLHLLSSRLGSLIVELLQGVFDVGILLDNLKQVGRLQPQHFGIGGREDGRAAGPSHQERHLAEKLAFAELVQDHFLPINLFDHPPAAPADQVHRIAFIALGNHALASHELQRLELVYDGPELFLAKGGEQGIDVLLHFQLLRPHHLDLKLQFRGRLRVERRRRRDLERRRRRDLGRRRRRGGRGFRGGRRRGSRRWRRRRGWLLRSKERRGGRRLRSKQRRWGWLLRSKERRWHKRGGDRRAGIDGPHQLLGLLLLRSQSQDHLVRRDALHREAGIHEQLGRPVIGLDRAGLVARLDALVTHAEMVIRVRWLELDQTL